MDKRSVQGIIIIAIGFVLGAALSFVLLASGIRLFPEVIEYQIIIIGILLIFSLLVLCLYVWSKKLTDRQFDVMLGLALGVSFLVLSIIVNHFLRCGMS